MKLKQCRVCHDNKYMDEFYKDVSRPDGVTTECKTCRTAYMKGRERKLSQDDVRLPPPPIQSITDEWERQHGVI